MQAFVFVVLIAIILALAYRVKRTVGNSCDDSEDVSSSSSSGDDSSEDDLSEDDSDDDSEDIALEIDNINLNTYTSTTNTSTDLFQWTVEAKIISLDTVQLFTILDFLPTNSSTTNSMELTFTGSLEWNGDIEIANTTVPFPEDANEQNVLAYSATLKSIIYSSSTGTMTVSITYIASNSQPTYQFKDGTFKDSINLPLIT